MKTLLSVLAGLAFATIFFAATVLCQTNESARPHSENSEARLFDTVGWLGSDDMGARVDNFAIQLLNEPYAEGYVIYYGPEGDGSGTGNFMLRVLRDYLANTRGLDDSRIKTVYGGRYKNLNEISIEFWLVPQSADPPKLKHYKNNVETFKGKFAEYDAWDGFADGGLDGPYAGDVTLAAFADVLRQQPSTIAYIVGYNARGATPGTWRRLAKRDAQNLEEAGIESSRIKIIFSGHTKVADNGAPNSAGRVQLWILASNAPPPVREARPERTPKKATLIGSYNSYDLKYPNSAKWIFEGFADVLRADRQLTVCIFIRPALPAVDDSIPRAPDEPPDVDLTKLVEKWKADLMSKYGVSEERIVVITTPPEEAPGSIETWVVPPGVGLPDPYADEDEPMEDENQ